MHTFMKRLRKVVWMEDLLVLITRIPTSVRDTSTQMLQRAWTKG